MQRSELLLVESSCNFDLSTIQHELCAIVHDVAKIVEDEAAVNTPYIIDLSEYSQKGECGIHLMCLNAEYEFVPQG